jgi:serine/threonine-protein kinase
MAFQLLVTAGPDQGRAFTLQEGPDLLLGRGERCLYRLNDPSVSRAHAQLLLEGDKVTIIDNGSKGGTLVNGGKVERRVLEPGDIIKLGDTQIRVQLGDFPLDVVLNAQSKEHIPLADGPVSLDAVMALAGTKLGHYDIDMVIGQGRIGIVFFATDTKDNRPVALKVLRPEFSKDEDDMQRFIRGMKTALSLRHPNLIAVYNAGKTNSFCWAAMEYIAGESMNQVIERIGAAGMLDWRYAYKVAVHVGRALEYAHGQSIIHRNVTPTNILLQATDKVVKLGDLILAKALEGALAKPITRPGELVGDVAFMSPEQTRGTSGLDGRSDLYQLGATLYALLTGRPPFTGSTLVEVVTRIRQTEPEKPTKSQMSIPSQFSDVVMRLLAKKPEDRYASATDLLRDLTRVGMFHNVTA